MKVLYITSDYSGVHKTLVEHLASIGNSVTVYIPFNKALAHRINEHYEFPNVKFYACAIQSYLDRFLYHNKIKKLVNHILSQDINWLDLDIIHAATCCVEGAIAYELSKIKNIPYIAAIRNTDLNVYFRYMVWNRSFFKKIIDNSEKIVLISPSYRNKTTSYINRSNSSKITFIPNGINVVFLNNKQSIKHISDKSTINIVYTGEITPNKNIIRLCYATKSLIEAGYNLNLTIIGKGKNDHIKTLNALEKLSDRFTWLKILPKQDYNNLIGLYKDSHIFAMVSHHETFGLVYIEALSQKLPILHSIGEGIDGVFKPNTVGIGVHSNNLSSIISGLEHIILNYASMQNNIDALDISQYSWTSIAESYTRLYKCSIKK